MANLYRFENFSLNEAKKDKSEALQYLCSELSKKNMTRHEMIVYVEKKYSTKIANDAADEVIHSNKVCGKFVTSCEEKGKACWKLSDTKAEPKKETPADKKDDKNIKKQRVSESNVSDFESYVNEKAKTKEMEKGKKEGAKGEDKDGSKPHDQLDHKDGEKIPKFGTPEYWTYLKSKKKDKKVEDKKKKSVKESVLSFDSFNESKENEDCDDKECEECGKPESKCTCKDCEECGKPESKCTCKDCKNKKK